MGKILFSFFMGAVGIIGALYILIVWGVVQPLLTVGEMIDKDTLTATALVWEFIKFLFRGVLAGLWAAFFVIVGGINIARK